MKGALVVFGIFFFLNLNVFAFYDTTKVLFSCKLKDSPRNAARMEVRLVDNHQILVVSTSAGDNNIYYLFGQYWYLNRNNIIADTEDIFEAEREDRTTLNILRISPTSGRGKVAYQYDSFSVCGGHEHKKESVELVDCKVVERM